MISQTVNRFEPIEIRTVHELSTPISSVNRLQIVRGRKNYDDLPMDSAFIIGISRTSFAIFGFYRYTSLFHQFFIFGSSVLEPDFDLEI